MAYYRGGSTVYSISRKKHMFLAKCFKFQKFLISIQLTWRVLYLHKLNIIILNISNNKIKLIFLMVEFHVQIRFPTCILIVNCLHANIYLSLQEP